MPPKKIRKRDGRIVDFDRSKITEAIFKAARAVGGSDRELAQKLSDQVVALIDRLGYTLPTVEEVQDLVEKVLIENGHAKTAKAYILYRKQHQDIRETKALISAVELMDDYLSQIDWRVRENSNMGYSLQGLNNYLTSALTSNYWLMKVYPPEVGRAHTEGDFHIHDLGILAPYCVGWDLTDLLLRGFGGVPGKTSSRPPRHLRSALGQLVNFFYTLQGEAAGAQAVSNWDTLLAPFVRYDGLDYRQVKQAVQEFVFNLNVPTRTGFQSLAWDELVVVRRRGRIEVLTIGELVDSQFEEHPTRVVPNVDGYGRPSEGSFAVPCYDDIEVLGWEGGKAKWLRAKAFIRHRVPSPIFLKVRTARGETFISPGHSLFAFRDGRIVPVRPHQLRTSRPNAKVGPEDHVVALGRIPEGCLRNEDSLDLADLISTLPYEAKRNIYVHISEGAFEELERYASRKQALYELGCRYYYDWQEKGMIPFLLWERFGERSDGGVLFSLRNYPEARQERTLRGEKLEAFLTVVACYLTEGKSTATSIVISQRAENLEKLESALEVLGMGTWSSANGRGTSTVVREVGLRGILACLIKHHCGYTASEKRIPYFVYDLSRPFREKFLQDLFEGDGHYDPKAHRYGFSSKSRKMTSGVSLLLASLGKCFVLAPKDRRKGVYGLFYYPEPKRRWPEEGDFVAAPVYEVYEELYPHEWEYDISVESETENFVGGLGGILFHNSPFTNITLDLVPPPTLKDEAVVVGGELRDETYGEFQEEMDMLNRAFAEVMIEGDAQERPFTFPIPTYNVSKDFNWDNPVLDFVFEMTAKYGVPYFANFINSDMKPEDAMSMCCRLRIDRREVKKRGGGLFAANPLTGSIGVVTINLPRIGYLSESEEEFFERLGRLMDVAKVSLEIKRKVVERFTEEGLYPYAKVYLEGVKASTGRYWDNHFSTIGLIGMNEALLNFMGKDIADPEGYEFGVKVLKFMRERLYQYQQETDNLYNLEATPAEGATYRLARLDKTRFPDIVTAGRDGEPYYTNSTHLPVYATEDLYEALKHQDGFQVLYTGGTVLHVFVGERLTSRAVKLLVRRIAENFHIPYYTITPTFSICPAHGYIPGEHPRCPKCGEESEVYSRVVGYLRPVKQWNDGKQTEFRERRHYSVGSS